MRPDTEPDEQSIYSVRGFSHSLFEGPLIEVIGRTHMGNGWLYLYELADRRLRLLLSTRAYNGNRHGRWNFRGGVLEVAYHGRPSEKTLEVELSGIMNEFPEDSDLDALPSSSWPCRKVFSWDGAEHRFRPDPARWEGFERYDD